MADANALQKIETLFGQNQKQEALQEYKSLMENAGEKVELWINYASFLFRCGQYDEAAAIAQKSISIKPTAEGFHNLACALKQLGRAMEAMEAFKVALNYNPDFAQTHSDLGLIYEEMGKYEHAIDHFQIITSIAPQNPTAWINVARARKNAGRLRESLSALRTARKIDHKSDALWLMYAELFKVLNDFEINRTLMDEISACLNNPRINSAHLLGIVQMIFLNQATIKILLPHIEYNKIQNFESHIQSKSVNWMILKHDVFLSMLTHLTIQNEDIEKLLIALRFHILQSVDQSTKAIPYIRELLPFVAALACQCFINEYIYEETPEEKQAVNRLDQKIKNNNPELTSLEIATYACYRPLSNLENTPALFTKFKSDGALTHLLRLQITEPLQEQEIKKTIKTLTEIDDEISLLVRDQYETNPYPRWTNTGTFGASSLQRVLKFLFPFLQEKDFNAINLNQPQTLIAGCGTGKQSIETAHQQGNTNLLALDLSASSLAFAIRKTKEYGLENIQYGIGDILKLRDLNQKFDVISCGGVLHHMRDPMEGWQALNDCLKPGGFMNIALYSQRARQHITAARTFITERGYKPDLEGIRACRTEIKLLAPHHPVRIVANSPDFYTTSSCRDLLLHVQEHHFTPLTLKKAIAELGLEFLGFQLPNLGLLRQYSALYPNDPFGRDLENWDDFEHQHPTTFNGMYQFWLKKPV